MSASCTFPWSRVEAFGRSGLDHRWHSVFRAEVLRADEQVHAAAPGIGLDLYGTTVAADAATVSVLHQDVEPSKLVNASLDH